MSADYKVTLECQGQQVVFETSVPLTESRTASWDNYGIIHMPTSLLAYRYTAGRRFSFAVRLVSRNPEEADTNASYLDLIRSWILPDFGDSGATPPILFLSGYRNNNVDQVQCVLVNYGWTFPDDVDYIYTSTQPMPVIGNLTIELDEIYSAEQISEVDPWKMVLTGSSSLGSSLDLSLNPFLSSTSLSQAVNSAGKFAGIASQSLLSAGNSLSKVASNPTSVFSNPSFGELTGFTNSGSISDTTKSSGGLFSQQTSTPLGESGGIPTSSSLSSGTSKDPFNRINLSVPSLIGF